ncbi:hypothetical protein ACHJH3_06775 [Campylobacter sp. MOP7]|uniref:hypothetical protein n=1 Tax=Campylobacter canis TaxID=3378588 RepID=UPI00387EA03E
MTKIEHTEMQLKLYMEEESILKLRNALAEKTQIYAWEWFQSDLCECANKEVILSKINEAGFKPVKMREVESLSELDGEVNHISSIEFINEKGSIMAFFKECSRCLKIYICEREEEGYKNPAQADFVMEGEHFLRIELWDRPILFQRDDYFVESFYD